MIPLQLTLKNFLSYREATLDFRGLHIACICGANGAGKSSLLEAIAWVLWGQSRAVAEDDVIHQGEVDALVDFTFQCHQQVYRVLRSRQRGQSSLLEFQVQTPNGFKPLTERGMRATQQLIVHHLKLDYDTFINSAYLRQGRADEFMLKRPSERKQILADLLKLDRYDDLAEKAKERSRHIKAEITVLERNLERAQEQLQAQGAIALEQEVLAAALLQMQRQQEQDDTSRQHWLALRQQRQTWEQQRQLQEQQQQHLTQECQRLRQEMTATGQQLSHLESVRQEEEAIAAGYAHLQQLQAEDEILTRQFQHHQDWQQQRQQLQHQQTTAATAIKDELRQVELQLDAMEHQHQELQPILAKSDDITAALERLHEARHRLAALDQLQLQATPLLRRRQDVQTAVERLQSRLTARLEELRSTAEQLQVQQQRHPQLQQAVLDLAEQLRRLDELRVRQQQVQEKGVERRSFMEQLQERQREYERTLAEIDHKIMMLQREGEFLHRSEPNCSEPNRSEVHHSRIHSDGQREEREPSVQLPGLMPQSITYPPCPLCDRPLDEHHWKLVLERHRAEQAEIRGYLWVTREQLTTSEREIKVLRQEYKELDRQLETYTLALERRGQLQEQIQGTLQGRDRLRQVIEEWTTIHQSLLSGSFAPELLEELRLLDHSLQQLSYDDRTHALARGEVDRWRWAEIRSAELKQAQRQLATLEHRQPELDARYRALEQQLLELNTSTRHQQIQHLDRQLVDLNYRLEHHTAVRQALRQAQIWQVRYQELQQVQQHYPQLQERLTDLQQQFEERQTALAQVNHALHALAQQIDQTPDPTEPLHTLERQMQERRSHLDDAIANLGRIQQQQQHLQQIQQQAHEQEQTLQALRHQYRVYQELAQSFGKNGIQALMIENLLPQLEAETNRILGQLSANQLHVQFVTQRSGKRKGNQFSDRLIDTLDILIADVRGTRPYETYSGGEAFRVNFAIRLALARLLAQRSGTALQLLIVDEGFGTQDDAGCDRLISAIQAIAADFACILTVTHMPRFKEAFQSRIEVYKTEEGSCLSLTV